MGKKSVVKKSATIKQNYNENLLHPLRWVAFVGMMIYPIFVAIKLLFPGHDWPYMHSLTIGNFDLTPWGAAIFVLVALCIVTLRPKTRKSIFATIVICNLAAIFFSWVTAHENVLAYIGWFLVLFITQVFFGWLWFTISSVIMIAIELGELLYDINHNISDQTIIMAIITTLVIIALVIFTSLMRKVGTVRIEVLEELENREKMQYERLFTVMNSISDATMSVNSLGEIQFYNSATLSLLDTNVNLEGVKIDDILKLTDEYGQEVKITDLMKDMTASAGYSNLSHTYSDNQKINLHIGISLIRNIFTETPELGRQIEGAILIIRDITKQKSLDDEKDEFISVVSHELRTPVAVMEAALSNVQLLVEKGGDTKLLSESLASAHDQVVILAAMLNDLSTLSRAQRGVYMDPEKINIKEFIDRLIRKYTPIAEKNKLDLKNAIHIDGEINAPRMYIEEIMQNLINNAIRYTYKGSVTIGVRLARGENKVVEFYVKDTGIGISLSDQKHIFQKFWRSEDYRTRETGGSGLGLYIVGQLADKMNTKLEVVSRLNHGSTFSFKLPLIINESTKKSKEKISSKLKIKV